MAYEGDELLENVTSKEYEFGFTTNIESDKAPAGLNEDIIRLISSKKNEPQWLLDWRLEAFEIFQKMTEPEWAHVKYEKPNLQAISFYAAPKQKKVLNSLDEMDPELRKTMEKLGISIEEQKRLSGVAVDFVMDSVSVATSFKEKLGELGIIFCSISDAVQEYPELIKKYLGTVIPRTDNYYAALNSAVFTDGSFCYIPKGVRCPMELSTYFRINEAGTGQFERTLLIADEESYVSYLEGCTAPQRDENQLHAAVVELVAMRDAEIKYSTVQNWYPGDKDGKGGIFNFVTKRGKGVFNGKVYVHIDAQKTNAYQSNANIMMSDNASMFTKPELEIYADDVKCSHGSTTGQFNEEALFYLRARGLSEESAKRLLVSAFTSDVMNRISIPNWKEYVLATLIQNEIITE